MMKIVYWLQVRKYAITKTLVQIAGNIVRHRSLTNWYWAYFANEPHYRIGDGPMVQGNIYQFHKAFAELHFRKIELD